jgi:hypothetical protein
MHEPVVVGEAVAGRSATVRKELARMSSHMRVSTFDMILLLCEALENGYAPLWGYASLPEYGERELGLKPSKTRYLARIGKVTKAVGLKRGQYQPAGVSKLREIVTLNPEGSFYNKETRVSEPLDEHIVNLILNHDLLTVAQMKDEVARLKGQVGPDRRVIRSYSTDVSTWENVIKPAYEKARLHLGSKGRDDEGYAEEYADGACQEMICAAFLANLDYEPEKEEIKLPMEGI